jgi:cytochrome b6-f complex iron-sulfur subunit
MEAGDLVPLRSAVVRGSGTIMATTTRRGFLSVFLGGAGIASLGAILYPVLAYLKPPRSGEADPNAIKAATVDELPLDSGKIFRFGSKPGILIHTASGEFLAFSATCTHLACVVQYRPDLRQIWCACHNGRYDLTGRNVAGPPPRPLDVFRVVVQGKDVIVSRQS